MNNIATFFRESATGRFFIPLGIVCIIFSILLFIISDHNKDYIKTEAIVSNTELVEEAHTDENGDHVDAIYKVYAKYTVNGVEYDEEVGELSGFKKGDKITIYYNPKNPREISQPVSIIVPIALLIGGIASTIGGIISIINAIKKHKKMKIQEEAWANGK